MEIKTKIVDVFLDAEFLISNPLFLRNKSPKRIKK